MKKNMMVQQVWKPILGQLFLSCALALVWMMPSAALAKKCPPNHFQTKKGCKKCPAGTFSKAGAKTCTDKPCSHKIDGKEVTVASGKSICIPGLGERRKCYRGAWKANGNCKMCKTKVAKYAHGHRECEKGFWKTCDDGTWKKGKACKIYKGCMPLGGMPAGPHDEAFCNPKDRHMYSCQDGKWVKGKACPKKSCTLNKTEFKDGATTCKPGKKKGEGSLVKCEDGKWKTIAKTCKKKK